MPRPLSSGIATLLLTTVAGFAQTATAPAPAPVPMLEEVIVTANRTEETLFETPYTAHVITRERFLEERSARTLPDALRETPGVLLQRTGYGQTSPFIRGFTGFRTLFLIDGIRLNNAVFREGPNQYFSTIDLLTIDQIDVVKGPSSVLYGSDAIGGTVNAITRDPEMLPWPTFDAPSDGKELLDKKVIAPVEERFAFHPGGYYRYASAENSHTVRGEFGLALTPHVGVLGGVTWKDYDDLRGGDLIGLQPGSAYSEIDGDIKVVGRPAENLELTAAFYRVEQNNVPRTHSTIFGKSFDGTDVGTDRRRDLDQLRELAYFQVEAFEVAPWLDRVKLSLSFHRQSEEHDRIRSDRRREVVGFQDDQYGLVLAMESPSPIGQLSYGVEYYHDEVDSWGSDWNADGSLRGIRERGSVADDATYDLLGVYLQDRFRPVEPLEITLGVRYSWAEAQADKVDVDPTDAVFFDPIDKVFDAFTASIRARLDVTRDWNFFGGVSQGFRAPNLSDFTSFELARSGERELPAGDLEEERYVSFEIGTKARFPTLRANVYAAYYYTLIEDQIVRFPTGQVRDGEPLVTRANAGDGYVQGIEFGAEWNFWKGFTLFGNLSWTEGEVDSFLAPGELVRGPASRIQPLTGLLGLRWRSADQRWFLEAAAELARHQDRLSPGDMTDTQRIPPGGSGGYSVYSLRASYQATPQVRFFAECENVTNEDYRYLGSGINEPGTNVIVGTQVRF